MRPYRRTTRTPGGLKVEVDTRVYPGISVHPLTKDRAIHINIAARPSGSEHRVHIAEIKTQLGEHQDYLARQLVDRLCRRIENGTIDLEPAVLLGFEELTPDRLEEWVAR